MSTNQTLSYLLVLCFIFAACTNQPIKVAQNNTLRITIDSIQQKTDTIQLGRMLEGEQISGKFIVENNKEEPLVITNIVTGCGCTTTSYDTKPIKPGEQTEVRFTFDSKGRQGLQIKTIDVISADFLMTRVVIQADIKK